VALSFTCSPLKWWTSVTNPTYPSLSAGSRTPPRRAPVFGDQQLEQRVRRCGLGDADHCGLPSADRARFGAAFAPVTPRHSVRASSWTRARVRVPTTDLVAAVEGEVSSGARGSLVGALAPTRGANAERSGFPS
jgi:hypothetical protein